MDSVLETLIQQAATLGLEPEEIRKHNLIDDTLPDDLRDRYVETRVYAANWNERFMCAFADWTGPAYRFIPTDRFFVSLYREKTQLNRWDLAVYFEPPGECDVTFEPTPMYWIRLERHPTGIFVSGIALSLEMDSFYRPGEYLARSPPLDRRLGERTQDYADPFLAKMRAGTPYKTATAVALDCMLNGWKTFLEEPPDPQLSRVWDGIVDRLDDPDLRKQFEDIPF